MRFKEYLGEENDAEDFSVLDKLWSKAKGDEIKFRELAQIAYDEGDVSFDESYPVAIKNFLKSKGVDEE